MTPRFTAFEIEVEHFWADRLCKLGASEGKDVWLTPGATLSFRNYPTGIRVGGCPYNGRVWLIDFREDAFEALEKLRGRR